LGICIVAIAKLSVHIVCYIGEAIWYLQNYIDSKKCPAQAVVELF